ncbi:MAG: hypothetical protein ACYCVL_09725 [Gemmatimonadaceae bacterium]
MVRSVLAIVVGSAVTFALGEMGTAVVFHDQMPAVAPSALLLLLLLRYRWGWRRWAAPWEGCRTPRHAAEPTDATQQPRLCSSVLVH